MMIHPGKKLNFMGNELGEYKEWDEKVALGWNILKYPIHDSFHKFMIRLNEVYKTYPCMYEQDYGMDGFEWLVVDDHFEDKLDRLKTFYGKALNEVGWNKYSRISLEFSNQIICTKHQ